MPFTRHRPRRPLLASSCTSSPPTAATECREEYFFVDRFPLPAAETTGYSQLQAARCCVALATSGGDMVPGRRRPLLASRNEALAYVLLAAVAAAIQASVVA